MFAGPTFVHAVMVLEHAERMDCVTLVTYSMWVTSVNAFWTFVPSTDVLSLFQTETNHTNQIVMQKSFMFDWILQELISFSVVE